MTELVKLSDAQKATLRHKPLKDVSAELVASKVKPGEAKELVFPTPVEVTDSVAKAIREIGKLFNKVAPESARALDQAEIAHLTAEAEALVELGKLFGTRLDNIKEYVRNHADSTGETTGEKDSQGHNVVSAPKEPFVVKVPGSNTHWSNEYRNGTVSNKTNKIQDMYDKGELTHDQYLALTTQVRVPDEDKIRDYVLKTGDLELLEKLTEVGRPVQALNLRGIKKK